MAKELEPSLESVPEPDDENKERGNWSNQAEFVLSCIGYFVGLGNIWRFPYLCMRNGGGAFLIPYFTFLFLCGIPLFYLELSIGQFSSMSPIEVWNICPLFKGLGLGMVIVSAIMAVYYNVIISWILYYLGKSFVKELPWATCGNSWNTALCLWRSREVSEVTVLSEYQNSTTLINTTSSPHLLETAHVTQRFWNNSLLQNVTNDSIKLRSPAEEFWEFNVLQRSPGIEHFDGIRWELLICLVVAWILIFMCLCKGIKSLGKVVYVTATFPYVFLLILLIRGLMLPGAMDGVVYYIYPDFTRLMKFQTWGEACLQIFYSLGPAWGSILTMASYNKFHYNCQRDALILPLVNCGTSFFAGFVIFSIIGFMARDAGLPVSKVITSGPGLVFMAYPEAISRMPLSPLWAVCFFLMLLTIGLDSQFGMVEAVVSGIVDCYPKKLMKWKAVVTLITCIILFLLGLPLVTRGGLYYFQIVDWFSSMYSVAVIAFMECIVVAWIYGWRRFYADIALMLGHEPGQIWRILWCFVTPTLMASVVIFSSAQMSEPTYGDYVYPRWAIGMGWVFAMVALAPIPIMAGIQIYSQTGTLWQRIRKAAAPSPKWGPSLEIHRASYIYKVPFKMDCEMDQIHEKQDCPTQKLSPDHV